MKTAEFSRFERSGGPVISGHVSLTLHTDVRSRPKTGRNRIRAFERHEGDAADH